MSYLQIHASGGPWNTGPNYTYSHYSGLVRYATAPTVRIAEDIPEHERALIHHAVAVINRELPYQWHLQFGSDAPPRSAIDRIPDNQIFVEYAPPSERNVPYRGCPNDIAGTEHDIPSEYDSEQGRWEEQVQNKAHIRMSSEYNFSDIDFISVLMHEFIHALGFHGHVEAIEGFPNSIMGPKSCSCN